MNHTSRFDGKGEIYAKARPKYAAGLFDYLKNRMNIPGGSVFADIGSGTGIFAEQLLGCGYRVFAVEPNDDMRRKAEEKLGCCENFISVSGNDADMHLPDNSADCITAAQSFHWFDSEAFRKECRRVLKPGGRVLIVYNSRDEKADCTKALAALRRKYNPEFHGFSNGISNETCMDFFTGSCEIFRSDNTQTYCRQDYINRVLSSSYSINENEESYGTYLREINEIFDSFSRDGYMTIPTETIAYIGDI